MAQTNSEYWQQRAEAVILNGEKDVEVWSVELNSQYKYALAQIQKELDAFYGKYAKNNKISFAEAKRRLNVGERKDFNTLIKEYFTEINRLGNNANMAPFKQRLIDLSAKTYISRLDELMTNIEYQTQMLAARTNTGMSTILTNNYLDGYYTTIFGVQTHSYITSSFTTVGGDMVEKAISRKWIGDNYNGRVWNDKAKLVSELNTTIPRSFVMGLNSKEIGRAASKRMGVSYKNMVRLLRTEVNHICNESTMEGYKQMGLKQYEYLATLDMRTSEICKETDGMIFFVKDAAVGVNMPPLHVHCRSTTIPYFDDNDIEDRLAKDSSKKNYYVDGSTKYSDWVQEKTSTGYAQKVNSNLSRYNIFNP